jgi:hypothetical protein
MGGAVDVYGVAALAYAALVGVGPFERARPAVRTVAQLHGDAPAPSLLRGDLPASVDRVLLGALSPDPAKRPASVVAFCDALERALEGVAPPSRTALGFEPRSRGLMFGDYRRAARAALGDAREATLFASLPAETRDAFDAVADIGEFYPAVPLVEYLRAFAAGHMELLESLGESLSPGNLASALLAMRVARTPEAMLHVVQPLMARFHDWARVSVAMTGARQATTRLHMPPGFAPEMCHYFTGVARALLAMGGRKAHVRSGACQAEGAECCEMKIEWDES